MQREREAGIERPGMKRRRAGKGGVSTSPFLPLLDQTPFHGRADTSPTEYGNHQGLVRPEKKKPHRVVGMWPQRNLGPIPTRVLGEIVKVIPCSGQKQAGGRAEEGG